jgi:hypothetical protein
MYALFSVKVFFLCDRILIPLSQEMKAKKIKYHHFLSDLSVDSYIYKNVRKPM